VKNPARGNRGLTAEPAGEGAWSARQAPGEFARGDEPMVRAFEQTLRRVLRLDGPCEPFLG
jgi:hypothetical protein